MILDLGCGQHKIPGAIGMDLSASADIQRNIIDLPWPFPDEHFDRIESRQVFEHLPWGGDEPYENLLMVIEECWRTLKPGGVLHIETPHIDSMSAVGFPFHRRQFNEQSFTYCASTQAGNYNPWPYHRFASIRVWTDREFALGRFNQYHAKKYLPRLYAFACRIGFGTKSNLFVDLTK